MNKIVGLLKNTKNLLKNKKLVYNDSIATKGVNMGLIKDFLALFGFGARTKKEEVPIKSDVSAKVKPDLVADTAALFGVSGQKKVSVSDPQKGGTKETGSQGYKNKVSEPRSGSWNIKPGQGAVPQSKAVSSRHDDRQEIDGSVGLGMGLMNPLHPLNPLSPVSLYQDNEGSSSWSRREETPAPAEVSTPVKADTYSTGNGCGRDSINYGESSFSSQSQTSSYGGSSPCSDSVSSSDGGGGGGGGD